MEGLIIIQGVLRNVSYKYITQTRVEYVYVDIMIDAMVYKIYVCGYVCVCVILKKFKKIKKK